MDRKQLKMIRLYAGMSQQDFADYINVARSTISKIEAGYINVSDVTKARALRKFDTKEESFIRFCERMKGSNSAEFTLG